MAVTLQMFRTALTLAAKRLWFGARGEPIEYGRHKLRYLVGSRPVRLKYASSTDAVARNDAKQIQYFLDSVLSAQLVLDIGGHYGEYAVLFAALVGARGQVVTFEPDAAARPVLRANVALNGFEHRVRVEEFAIFDKKESRQLFARHGNSQSSLARAGLGGAANEEDVEPYFIQTIPLDEYLSEARLPIPDFIKLDYRRCGNKRASGGWPTAPFESSHPLRAPSLRLERVRHLVRRPSPSRSRQRAKREIHR